MSVVTSHTPFGMSHGARRWPDRRSVPARDFVRIRKGRVTGGVIDYRCRIRLILCQYLRGGPMEKVNLTDKLSLITEHWRPKVVGALNGQEVKLVKFQGTFVWHHH